MSDPALEKLLTIAPPPKKVIFTRGDRDAARAAAGWAIPDHVLDVTEAYGHISWLDWMLQPSPFTTQGLEILTNVLRQLEEVAPGKRSLVAVSDPDGTLLFVDDDGMIAVSTDGDVVSTHRTLAEVLSSWLSGDEGWGLFPPIELTGANDIAPFALPIFDVARPSEIVWAFVEGGAPKRAQRWEAFRAAIAPHVLCARVSGGETQQDRVYIDELELVLFYDSYNRSNGAEQIQLRYYLDRKPEVKAMLERGLAAAGMKLVAVQGLRGDRDW